MTSLRILLVSSTAVALSSCSWFGGGSSQGNYDTPGATNGYDTSNPYGVPGNNGSASYQQSQQQAPAPGSATYSQAAYEDSGSTTPSASAPTPPPAPPVRPPAHTAAADTTPAAPASHGSGTVHVVGKGDTLWGLSKKYNVPVDAIKKANGLTKDTVVLGAKLQIPAK